MRIRVWWLAATVAMVVTAFFAGMVTNELQAARQARAACARAPASSVRLAACRVRPEPERFPRDTHLQRQNEPNVSGATDPNRFSPGRDLVYVTDPRVWWESEHDKWDNECDHSIHRQIVEPLRRVIELVAAEGGTLEIHDAYRPHGVHSTQSLHQEGRALDLTCDQLGYERLARLCWVAGFDWVYYEVGAKVAPHIHVSVKAAEAPAPAAPTNALAMGGTPP